MVKPNTLKHLSDEAKDVFIDTSNTPWSDNKNVKTAQDAFDNMTKFVAHEVKATTEEYGLVKLADDKDIDNGKLSNDVVTSKQLIENNRRPQADYKDYGTTRYATEKEVKDGKSTTTSINPKELNSFFNNSKATVDKDGVIKLSHESMVVPGLNNDTAMTPKLVKYAIDRLVPDIAIANEDTTGTVTLANIQVVLNGVVREGYAISPYVFKRANATNKYYGTVRLATDKEVRDGTLSDGVAISPKSLGNMNATTTQSGIVKLATENDAKSGSSDTLSLTPKSISYINRAISDIDGNIFKEHSKKLTTENLNNVLESGVYHQTSNVNATQDRNYPSNSLVAGTLVVYNTGSLSSSSSGLKQIYYPYKNAPSSERFSSDGKTWSSWVENINSSNFPEIATPKEAIEGVINDKLLTPKSLEEINKRIGEMGGWYDSIFKDNPKHLTNENLNNIIEGGIYHQNLSRNATTSRNYPSGATVAGSLVVLNTRSLGSSSSGVRQIYYPMGNLIPFTRHSRDGRQWDAWVRYISYDEANNLINTNVKRLDGKDTDLQNQINSLKSSMVTHGVVPVGSIIDSFQNPHISTGFVLADGRTLNRNDYPELFSVLGYRFGGSGNNFKLPDMRGLYTRGTGKGSNIKGPLGNISGGGSVGTVQEQQVRYHKHVGSWGVDSGFSGAYFGASKGRFAGSGSHDYNNDRYWTNDGRPWNGNPNPDGIIGTENRPWTMSVYKIIRVK